MLYVCTLAALYLRQMRRVHVLGDRIDRINRIGKNAIIILVKWGSTTFMVSTVVCPVFGKYFARAGLIR